MTRAQESSSQTLQTRTIACIAVAEAVGVMTDFVSQSTPSLNVHNGDLIKVTVDLDAIGRGKTNPGFYWGVNGDGPVAAVIGVRSCVYAGGSAWFGYSTTAFFKANGTGPATFNIQASTIDLAGEGAIRSLVITAENLGSSSQSTK
jgi:Variant SH3 domain